MRNVRRLLTICLLCLAIIGADRVHAYSTADLRGEVALRVVPSPDALVSVPALPDGFLEVMRGSSVTRSFAVTSRRTEPLWLHAEPVSQPSGLVLALEPGQQPGELISGGGSVPLTVTLAAATDAKLGPAICAALVCLEGNGFQARVKVDIPANVINVPPVARDDTVCLESGQTITFDPTANDSDPDGSTLRITRIDQPRNGSASIAEDGTITCRLSSADRTGDDQFTYWVTDNDGGAASATVVLRIGH